LRLVCARPPGDDQTTAPLEDVLVSLLAIYPFVVMFQATIVPTIKTWPLLVRSAILPLTLLALMTFLVMPVVTRVVQSWLSRGN
jgi:antibiotic biosynthesis monooxygenase (ABM) superfamily enzyme